MMDPAVAYLRNGHQVFSDEKAFLVLVEVLVPVVQPADVRFRKTCLTSFGRYHDSQVERLFET